MEKFKYYAVLKNLDQLEFDSNYFNNIQKIKEWAKDRGSIYDLTIYYIDSDNNIDMLQPRGYYYIKNNRIYSYK